MKSSAQLQHVQVDEVWMHNKTPPCSVSPRFRLVTGLCKIRAKSQSDWTLQAQEREHVRRRRDAVKQQSSCSVEQRPPEGARTAPRTARPCSSAGAVRLHLVAPQAFGSVPAARLFATCIHCNTSLLKTRT